MEIKIEKNIPVTKKLGHGIQYPWDKMEVGDSFFLECSDNRRISILSNAISYYKSHIKGAKLTTRKEGKGYRFWRIK